MAKPLTSAGIRSMKTPAQRREVRDGGSPGLYVALQASGHRSFVLRFRRPDGRPGKLTLGVFDPTGEGGGDAVIGRPLTLGAARQLASELNRERARGRDIIGDHKAAKARMRIQHQEGLANTFGQAARDFVENHAKPKTRGWRRTARLLGLAPDGESIGGSLADRWAERPVATIDAHAIDDAVEEARQRGVPGRTSKTDGPSEARARQLFSCLSSMFAWLHRHRRVESSPSAGMHRPEPARSRDRVLSDAEIAKFWRACSGVGEPFGAIFKLLLLSGGRLNEVAGLRHSELSDDGAIWTIPGERTKNKRAHVVPLPPAAREIIAAAMRIEGCPFVFTTNGRTPVSGWSKIKKRLDRTMGDVPPWRLHDLRRTTATGMATIGVAPHVVEAALNHISGAKAGVAGTYNRAIYAAEKKSALERWAAYVEALVAGRSACVVPMRRQP
jgi:integrase